MSIDSIVESPTSDGRGAHIGMDTQRSGRVAEGPEAVEYKVL